MVKQNMGVRVLKKKKKKLALDSTKEETRGWEGDLMFRTASFTMLCKPKGKKAPEEG